MSELTISGVIPFWWGLALSFTHLRNGCMEEMSY